jgi:DNA recombination protein RmuC
MQSVATNIVDLKRVLSNVKTRGTWGEVQLGNLLADILTPEQFERNFKPSPRSGEVVEFAVKLPGDQTDASRPVYLPIDSKFPIEDYERLSAAAQIGDREAVEKASNELAKRVKSFAMDIRNKYIRPGVTTNFAILFLPTEGLYAEIIRRDGLADEIQREQRVLIAGPTTLAALLNSLQMGFRTLAIQKNSAEIAKALSVVKTDFLRFGELLEKVSAKLSDAQNAVAKTVDRHRIASKRLEKVESLEATETTEISL